MPNWTAVVLTLCGVAVAAALAAAAFVWSGLYSVAATREHWQFVYSILETAMRQSVQRSARNVPVPAGLDTPGPMHRGAACFREHCVQCHGAPGVAQAPIGRSMQPLPGPLADAQQRWQLRELYWITKHGIRMSGMPAWEFRLAEEDLWALAAFVHRLPQLSPADYAAATKITYSSQPGAPPALGCSLSPAQRDATPQRSPDLERGRTALSQYACTACHSIPGVTSSSPQVGPPLAGMASRTQIAGRLANTPQNMVHWLRHPRDVDPMTAMPDLELTEADARDIAAYLATLR